MKTRFLIPSLMLLMISSAILGQTTATENNPCPKIEIFGPPAVIQPGEPMKFRIEIENPEKYEFEWTVFKGSLLSGQGSSEILAGEIEEFQGHAITASVKIKGIPSKCPGTFSDTGVIAQFPSCGSPLDEFGKLANDDVRERIDNLMIDLQANPRASGHLINYGPPDEVSRRNNLIRDHLEFRDYDSSRVIIEYRGYDENIRTRVWRVPEGADTACID